MINLKIIEQLVTHVNGDVANGGDSVARCPLPSPATMDDWAVLFLEHCAEARAWGFHLVNFGFFSLPPSSTTALVYFAFRPQANRSSFASKWVTMGFVEKTAEVGCGAAEVRVSARYQQRLTLLPPSLTIGYLAFTWRGKWIGLRAPIWSGDFAWTGQGVRSAHCYCLISRIWSLSNAVHCASVCLMPNGLCMTVWVMFDVWLTCQRQWGAKVAGELRSWVFKGPRKSAKTTKHFLLLLGNRKRTPGKTNWLTKRVCKNREMWDIYMNNKYIYVCMKNDLKILFNNKK